MPLWKVSDFKLYRGTFTDSEGFHAVVFHALDELNEVYVLGDEYTDAKDIEVELHKQPSLYADLEIGIIIKERE